MNRDNQQEIGLIGWLAGIIDGEGTVSLTVRRRNERGQAIQVNPRVSIANTDAGIIVKCIEAFEIIGVGHYRQDVRPIPRRLLGVHVAKFKPVTMLEINGFKRVRTLLNAVGPFLAGDKASRSRLLLTFINGRIGYSESSSKAQNVAYRQEDVNNAIAFLRETKTKQIDHITKILNEHTREAGATNVSGKTKKPETIRKMSESRKQYWANLRNAKMCSDLTGDR